jgi:tellurite resistance protein TehA-like permease
MRAAKEKIGPALLNAAETLWPGYFALVMATGIVSIACRMLAIPAIPYLLIGVDWAAYAVLWLLTLIRLWRYPSAIIEDLSDHQRAPGFFTLVAGTCVLGAESAAVADASAAAIALWYAGLGLWFLVMYAFFIAVTIAGRKPPLAPDISGAWLMAAVATQSIVVLRGILGAGVPPSPEIQFLCLAMFMLGCLLYLAIIPLILYRLTFVRFAVEDFSPPYWINMGAAAITVLAGSILLLRAEKWMLLQDYAPFLKGLTVFFWAAATWWIPFLAALVGWRYLVFKDRLHYEPQIWSMVFPLGMYTAASFELSNALGLPFMAAIPRVFIFVALAAWVLAFACLLLQLARFAVRIG